MPRDHDTIETLATPCLVLDAARMERNLERLARHLASLGVAARPHLKTAKSVPVALRMMASPRGPATVSTLKEAEEFAAAGVTDLLYAVAITPNKLERVRALRGRGVDLSVVTDDPEAARALAGLPVLIEIDTDGHRAGIAPGEAERLLAVAAALRDAGAELRGVMTHAGDSYSCRTREAHEAMAEQERSGAVRAAETLRAAGHAAPVVSVGSTPTAHFARRLDGVTEVRAGVYVFQDLVMAGLGVCAVDDIAMGVLATVIGHQRAKGWILVDAGWMAMSRDRGTAKQDVDQGYGLVCDVDGRPYGDLVMVDANQEHGILSLRPGSAAALPELPVGALVRILPNHACATAAQHGAYAVVRGGRAIEAHWPRFNGW